VHTEAVVAGTVAAAAGRARGRAATGLFLLALISLRLPAQIV